MEISSLIFKLIKGCSNVGANQINLNWYAPDYSGEGKASMVHFATQEGDNIQHPEEFNWARSEVSAAANLHKVAVWYEETGIHTGFGRFPGPPTEISSRARIERSNQGLMNSLGSTRDCQATLDHTVTYQLRAHSGINSAGWAVQH